MVANKLQWRQTGKKEEKWLSTPGYSLGVGSWGTEWLGRWGICIKKKDWTEISWNKQWGKCERIAEKTQTRQSWNPFMDINHKLAILPT
jgi:hypothetical protein